MDVIFRKLTARWTRLNARRAVNYFGIVVDDPHSPLTNFQFADDVLLIASSNSDIVKMITDLQKEASKYGLHLHMGKTVVLTNVTSGRPSHIQCASQSMRVLREDEAENYLGRQLSARNFHRIEIRNRIARGLAALFKVKDVLCNRRVFIRDRIRFFEAAIVPCILYACRT